MTDRPEDGIPAVLLSKNKGGAHPRITELKMESVRMFHPMLNR